MSGFVQINAWQSNFVQGSSAPATFCFDSAYFDSAYFDTCDAPVVETINQGLLLDPPPGWTAMATSGRSGPLNPRAVLTSIDFNRDDPDELWLLGLTDLETN